jgi:hypothetical protein
MDAVSCGGVAHAESRARRPACRNSRSLASDREAHHSRVPPQVGVLAYDTAERDMHGDR